MLFGSAIHVPRDADKDLMEEKRAELERSMREITERVDGCWG